MSECDDESVPPSAAPPPAPPSRKLYQFRSFSATWLRSLKTTVHVEPKISALPLPSSVFTTRFVNGVPLPSSSASETLLLDALTERFINSSCRAVSWPAVSSADDDRLNAMKAAGALCNCGRPATDAIGMVDTGGLQFRRGAFAFEKCAAVMEINDCYSAIVDERKLASTRWAEHEQRHKGKPSVPDTPQQHETPSSSSSSSSSSFFHPNLVRHNQTQVAKKYNGLLADYLLDQMEQMEHNVTSNASEKFFRRQSYDAAAKVVRSLPNPLQFEDIVLVEKGSSRKKREPNPLGLPPSPDKKNKKRSLPGHAVDVAVDVDDDDDDETKSAQPDDLMECDDADDDNGALPLMHLKERGSPGVFSPPVAANPKPSPRKSALLAAHARAPGSRRPGALAVGCVSAPPPASLKQCGKCFKYFDHRTPLHRVVEPLRREGAFQAPPRQKIEVTRGGSIGKNLFDAIDYFGSPYREDPDSFPALRSACSPEAIALKKLQTIWGVGPRTAQKLFSWGILDIAQLRADQQVLACLNKQQLIGLRHCEDLQKKIPRDEVSAILAYVESAASRVYENRRREAGLPPGGGLKVQACGSYRRGNERSGDVDVLITPRSEDPSCNGEAVEVMDLILKDLRRTGFLTDDLTLPGEHGENDIIHSEGVRVSDTMSYMGVCRLPSTFGGASSLQSPPPSSSSSSFPASSSGSPLPQRLAEAPNPNSHRRVDIKAYPKCQEAFALLYFTGDAHFNRSMRAYVKRCGMTLTDAGMAKCVRGTMSNGKKGRLSVGRSARCRNEQQIFDILGLPYVRPEFRDTKRCLELLAGGGAQVVGEEDDEADDVDSDIDPEVEQDCGRGRDDD